MADLPPATASERVLSVTPATAGQRLDHLLAAACPEYSRSYLQRLVARGLVLVDGQPARASAKPAAGATVRVGFPPEPPLAPVAERGTLDILYEDDDVLALNKPAGLVVHPGAGTHGGTLVNVLLGYNPAAFAAMDAEPVRPGIVHRLDRDTSGVLVVAKHLRAKTRLSAAFAARTVTKTYLALVLGVPRAASGELRTPFGRHPVQRHKMAVLAAGDRLAVTHYELAASGTVDGVAVSLLRVRIETGRTHQIRVHLAHLGHPVLGDRVYGGARAAALAVRQLLHAWRLVVPHPMTKQPLPLTAPPPADFAAAARAAGIDLAAALR